MITNPTVERKISPAASRKPASVETVSIANPMITGPAVCPTFQETERSDIALATESYRVPSSTNSDMLAGSRIESAIPSNEYAANNTKNAPPSSCEPGSRVSSTGLIAPSATAARGIAAVPAAYSSAPVATK